MYVIHLESDLTHFNYSYSIYVALCRRSYSNLAGRFRHLLAHSTSDIQRRVFRNSNCLHNLYSNIIYTNEQSCLVNQIFRLTLVVSEYEKCSLHVSLMMILIYSRCTVPQGFSLGSPEYAIIIIIISLLKCQCIQPIQTNWGHHVSYLINKVKTTCNFTQILCIYSIIK